MLVYEKKQKGLMFFYLGMAGATHKVGWINTHF